VLVVLMITGHMMSFVRYDASSDTADTSTTGGDWG